MEYVKGKGLSISYFGENDEFRYLEDEVHYLVYVKPKSIETMYHKEYNYYFSAKYYIQPWLNL